MINLPDKRKFSAYTIANALISHFAKRYDLSVPECVVIYELSANMDNCKSAYTRVRPITLRVLTGLNAQQLRETIESLIEKKILYDRTKFMRVCASYSFHRYVLMLVSTLENLKDDVPAKAVCAEPTTVGD